MVTKWCQEKWFEYSETVLSNFKLGTRLQIFLVPTLGERKLEYFCV